MELHRFCKVNKDAALDKVMSADADGDGQLSMAEWIDAVNTNDWIKRFVCPRMFVQNAQSDMFNN
jgi:hypothetical protein